MNLRIITQLLRAGSLIGAVVLVYAQPCMAQLVPGTGQKATTIGDDFEDEKWEFIYNFPKSTENINGHQGGYGGIAKNDRWYEGIKRGTPDHVRRVETPAGGLPGSKGSMLLMSRDTGIPGRPSFSVQQDDFICDVNYKLGGSIPVSENPNVVVRVYMPPVSKWEKRSGPTFAFRAAVDATIRKNGRWIRDTYWPGMFIEFESRRTTGRAYDSAYFRIRSDETGGDYRGPDITETGWWTLGMSFTADGKVHYYAHKGLESLTSKDLIASHYPYGYRCEHFSTFFFNVCSPDDGRTWSTPWIVDDCEVYWIDSPRALAQKARTQAAANR